MDVTHSCSVTRLTVPCALAIFLSCFYTLRSLLVEQPLHSSCATVNRLSFLPDSASGHSTHTAPTLRRSCDTQQSRAPLPELLPLPASCHCYQVPAWKHHATYDQHKLPPPCLPEHLFSDCVLRYRSVLFPETRWLLAQTAAHPESRTWNQYLFKTPEQHYKVPGTGGGVASGSAKRSFQRYLVKTIHKVPPSRSQIFYIISRCVLPQRWMRQN